MRTRTLGVAALVASILAGLGCGRTLAPTAPDRSAATAVGGGGAITFDPGPPEPAGVPDADTAIRSLAPVVVITSPRPSPLIAPTVPPTFTVHWAPAVPSFPSPSTAYYRYRVFSENDPEFDFFLLLANPDSLLRFYAPFFPGWTRVDESVQAATIADQAVNTHHVFAIVAFDRRGNFSNVVSFSQNLLFYNVAPVPGTAESAAGTLPGPGSAEDPTPHGRRR